MFIVVLHRLGHSDFNFYKGVLLAQTHNTLQILTIEFLHIVRLLLL